MSDWSLMDPAIVSFRQQYQSFMSGPQQSQGDNMFLNPQHMGQPQMNGQYDGNKMKSQEYAARNNLMQSAYGAPHGLNLQNGIMGQQQQSNSPQVNFIIAFLIAINSILINCFVFFSLLNCVEWS